MADNVVVTAGIEAEPDGVLHIARGSRLERGVDEMARGLGMQTIVRRPGRPPEVPRRTRIFVAKLQTTSCPATAKVTECGSKRSGFVGSAPAARSRAAPPAVRAVPVT